MGLFLKGLVDKYFGNFWTLLKSELCPLCLRFLTDKMLVINIEIRIFSHTIASILIGEKDRDGGAFEDLQYWWGNKFTLRIINRLGR